MVIEFNETAKLRQEHYRLDIKVTLQKPPAIMQPHSLDCERMARLNLVCCPGMQFSPPSVADDSLILRQQWEADRLQ